MHKFKKSLSAFISAFILFNVLFIYKVSAVEGNYLSLISRKEVQERAYKMAYQVWHFIKGNNGTETSDTKLPDQLNGKNDSYEYGIPYNWGGMDGIDSSSSSKWSNFYDAVNKGAITGNVKCSGGYKSNTAGIDCSGFVQSTLKIKGQKQSTWTLGNYMNPIEYNNLKNMDLLLWKEEHVAFFQSWVYDDSGKILGANTIESTGGNYDGSGKKVKQYFRNISDITSNYTPMRYKEIGTDFIENNSKEPFVEAPLNNENVKKSSGNMVFKWTYNDLNGSQSAYRIRVYKGTIDDARDASGTLLTMKSEETSKNETLISTQDFSNGDYYFALETKNGIGYWSSPIISPFKIVPDSTVVDKKIESQFRYGGIDRYETSKIIAENTFKGKLNSVVLTFGENYPDGLCGATLAYKENAPILLVYKNVNSEYSQYAVKYILNNLNKNGKIYILGSEGVLDKSFENYFIAQGFSKSNIIRLGGNDRNETSVKIAEKVNDKLGTPIVIAWDSGFADTLSMSPIAAKNGWPILITNKGKLSDSIEKYINKYKPSMVYIVGGSGVVSEGVEERIKAITGLNASKVIRLHGTDRYETCKAINSNFFSNTKNVFIGYGENFPDSLCGSVMAAKNNSPILLLNDSSLFTTSSTLKKLTGDEKVKVHIFGTNRLISNYLLSKVENYSR